MIVQYNNLKTYIHISLHYNGYLKYNPTVSLVAQVVYRNRL